MCGRYLFYTPAAEIARLAGIDTRLNLAPRYNIAPTQDAPVVRLDDAGHGELAMLRWGLVPSWAKDLAIGARLINARAESASEKPAFRAAFRARRCLVPADGFYEWTPAPAKGQPKQPYLVGRADGAPFCMAGLWERWRGPEGPVDSFTILTTEAHPSIAAIHHRMPVMLAPEDQAGWLDPAAAPERLAGLLGPFEAAALRAVPVSPRVNNVRNDDATLIEPVELDPSAAQGRLL